MLLLFMTQFILHPPHFSQDVTTDVVWLSRFIFSCWCNIQIINGVFEKIANRLDAK